MEWVAGDSLHDMLVDGPLEVGQIFFFNDTATTEIYTLSLHDALPISVSLAPKWKRTPCSRCRSAKTPPSSGPRTPCSGVGAVSMTVTSAPYVRAAAATSR